MGNRRMKVVKDAFKAEEKIDLKMGFTNDKQKIVIDFGKPNQCIFFDFTEAKNLIKAITGIMDHLNEEKTQVEIKQ